MFKLSSSLYAAFNGLDSNEQYVMLGILIVGTIAATFLAWKVIRGAGHLISFICRPFRSEPPPSENPDRGIYEHLSWPDSDQKLFTPRREVDGRKPASEPHRQLFTD